MSTPLSELRGYRTSTRQMLVEGRDPFSVLAAADSRLVDVSNHVAICHHLIAEARAELRFAFFPDRTKRQGKIHTASEVIEEMEVLQHELIDVKGDCLSQIQSEIRRLWNVVKNIQEAP